MGGMHGTACRRTGRHPMRWPLRSRSGDASSVDPREELARARLAEHELSLVHRAADALCARAVGGEHEVGEFARALEDAPVAREDAVAALSGDSEKSYRSDSPEVRAAQHVLAEMTILFFKP